MVKRSGSIREGRAVDGKLRSHLEWPKRLVTLLFNLTIISDIFPSFRASCVLWLVGVVFLVVTWWSIC